MEQDTNTEIVEKEGQLSAILPLTLSLIDTTKEQRAAFISEIVKRIEDGSENPLEVHLLIKAMEDIIKTITSTDVTKNKNYRLAKRYKELLLEAATKYGKRFELHNAKFEIKECGVEYDFSNCGDEELLSLYEQQKAINIQIKMREEMLKTLPEKGWKLTIEETGEIKTFYRPTKKSNTSVTVTLI